MKKRKKDEHDEYGELFGQDEHFHFIAGFTSDGAPYGITWEQAYEEGFVDEDEQEKTAIDVRRFTTLVAIVSDAL